MDEGQGSRAMVVTMVLLIMDMERQIMKREPGQVLYPVKRNEFLSVTGQGTLIGGIVKRGNQTGTGLKGITGSTGTKKKKIVTETIGQEENEIQLMRMIGTEGSLLQDRGAGPEQCQKKITGLGQGMSIMGRGDDYHRSEGILLFILLWQIL